MEKKIDTVEYQDLRYGCFRYLLECSWPEYQKFVMTAPVHEEGDFIGTDYSRCFGNHVEYIWGEIDPFYDSYEEDQKIPYEDIGTVFKTQKEAELIFNFWVIFCQFADEVEGGVFYKRYILKDPSWCTNYEYFSHPLWPKMVEAAKTTLEEFIKNEEENSESMNIINSWKKSKQKQIDDRKAELARTGKAPY
jgi:hypothetical protein